MMAIKNATFNLPNLNVETVAAKAIQPITFATGRFMRLKVSHWSHAGRCLIMKSTTGAGSIKLCG